MEITVTLDHGPLNIEIIGDDRGDIEKEILGLAEFFKENEEALNEFDGVTHESGTKNTEDPSQTSATDWEDAATPSESNQPEFASLSTKTGVDSDLLSRLIEIPSSDEGTPSLNMYHFEEGVLTLGSARNQRQAQASSILLYAWEECMDKKKIKYTDLDEALIASDVESERRDAMAQAFSGDADDWFESDGSSIYLVGKGKNHARSLIEELAEQLQE